MNVDKAKVAIDWNIRKKGFEIVDMEKWIELTWKNGRIGMQRFAFQHLYNKTFSKETLESMDEKFGFISQEDIETFQRNVKIINNWNKLEGKKGYEAFYKYFGLEYGDMYKKQIAALNRSDKLGYHSFVIKKKWQNYIKKKERITQF